ncbi:MAG TPA: HEAT repeat domain-containing protein [Sandaracinaceae bacterium LLY-WYZ-13_1]|nr:HEAT repeat domain-containing protein [Sandaracinaceae bacterium LLY-WYZ-13_1]
MAAKSAIDRITKMLADEAPERRLAAVIVLGELAPKGAAVTAGLTAVLEDDGPALQRHALDALRRIGVKKKTLPYLWPLLSSGDAEVRAAAADAVASVGDAVVGEVRARLAEAEGEERRALESILSRLGGKEAFDALLEALAEGDEETNRATALELRHHVKEADGKARRSYRTRLEKFLKQLAEREEPAPSAMAAAVKILGFLEDPRTAKTLLALARDAEQPATVRQEALIALRFTMNEGASADVVRALVDAAGDADRALAQTAMMTLAGLELPGTYAPALAKLAFHPELERARIAIDKLGTLGGKKATETLVEIVARGDKRRAELAGEAVKERDDARPALVRLMAETEERERAKLVRHVLRPHVDALGPALRGALIDAGVERLGAGSEAWEPPLSLAAELAPDAVAERLAKEAAKLRKGRKRDAERRVLRAMVEHGWASDDQRYRLASLQLADSKLDPRARRSDRALRSLRELQRRGFDVASALRKDRSVGLEQLYYVGFCFLEDDVDAGEELLAEVVKKGGRKKIARAAKNKLALAGH